VDRQDVAADVTRAAGAGTARRDAVRGHGGHRADTRASPPPSRSTTWTCASRAGPRSAISGRTARARRDLGDDISLPGYATSAAPAMTCV